MGYGCPAASRVQVRARHAILRPVPFETGTHVSAFVGSRSTGPAPAATSMAGIRQHNKRAPKADGPLTFACPCKQPCVSHRRYAFATVRSNAYPQRVNRVAALNRPITCMRAREGNWRRPVCRAFDDAACLSISNDASSSAVGRAG